jgi:hypothetical protein
MNGFWAEFKEISASWSRGRSDTLVDSLTSTLSPMAITNIPCLAYLRCRCCPNPLLTGTFEPEETTFWALLTAVSRTNIQIKGLVLSNSKFSYFSPFMLPCMLSLISRNLLSLEKLVYAYPYRITEDSVTAEGGDEKREEEEDGFELDKPLCACLGLKTLFLNLYSFADLPNITMPHLTELRVKVVNYDKHFLDFLKRHRTIQRLIVSIRRNEYDHISEIDTSDYERCEIFDHNVDPWTGRSRGANPVISRYSRV